MKSFETIRKLAAQLHTELVAAGADPNDPQSLIAYAIKHFDLELTFLEPADPALKGAKALFDEQSGTICAAKLGSLAERALAVAHEIGHLVAHAQSCTCGESDIDASRSTETAPVGLQKVEDYGAKERRELEANVFAREMMFPRALARKRFLEDAASASDIASQTSLPLPLVRQQILDAVLLPTFSKDAGTKLAPAFKDDPAQERAARHRNSPYQLRAGPGTGKTRSLVRRIQSLLAESVQPAAILVLTFSNRTAGELSERLSLALSDQAAAIWVGTFHAFGLELVRRFHDKLGLPPDPTLFDRSDAIAVLEEILPTLPLKHYKNLWDPVIVLREILQAISRAKDEVVTASDYRALATAQDERAQASGDPDAIKAAEKVLEVASVYELYEKAKKDRQAVDFGDLIMLPTLLFEKDEAVRATRLRHRHLLVDEYQDVNRASVRLVKALAGDGKNLWVIGDARQSIYRFRGASSANMAAFTEDFPGGASEPLEINYRSTQKIIDAYAAFARGMAMPAELAQLDLEASRGEGTALPEIRGFDTPDDEPAGIAAAIRELERDGVALRDQAVLCRTNPRIDQIARALEARGIPVLHLGSLFEREEIRDLLSLLSLATDRFGAGLVRIAAMPRYQMPLQDVKAFARSSSGRRQARAFTP
jgi:DNA helicase II / ATP-dependent DNA helicase PcrA